MKSVGVQIVILLLSTNLICQSVLIDRTESIWLLKSKANHSLLSSRDVLNKLQNTGRLTQEVWQDWNSIAVEWGNSTQYLYNYGGDHDKLIEFTTQSWNNGNWIYWYSYRYLYDINGYLIGFNYYEWSANNWNLVGTGTYSQYDVQNNYGEETYSEQIKDGFEFKDRYIYKYDSNGNLIEYFSYYYQNTEWRPFEWYQHNYQGDCLSSSTSYIWDGANYVKASRLDFSYDYGCNDKIPFADFWWLFDGSPSEWIYHVWDGTEWDPSKRGVYVVNGCGWTTSGIMYSSYEKATMTWVNDNSQGFIYYNNNCGIPKTVSAITDDDVRATLALYQEKENNQWVNSQRTWLSYENLQLVTESETAVPDEFALAQNYPNPFNPKTVIEFSLSEETNVNLSVYDLTGKLIKELANTPMQIGNYNITWNGTDTNGAKVGAGVYLYKLQTDNFSESRKMILLK